MTRSYEPDAEWDGPLLPYVAKPDAEGATELCETHRVYHQIGERCASCVQDEQDYRATLTNCPRCGVRMFMTETCSHCEDEQMATGESLPDDEDEAAWVTRELARYR
jgi:hypothetical protein